MEHPAFVSYKAINTLWVEDNMSQFTVAPTLPAPEITSTLISTEAGEEGEGGATLPVKGSTAHTLELNWNVATADSPDIMPDYEEHSITIRSLGVDRVDSNLLNAKVVLDGTELEIRIHPAIVSGGKDDIEGLVKVPAPHDGLLVNFTVKEGEMVTEGQELGVISRMKMVGCRRARANFVCSSANVLASASPDYRKPRSKHRSLESSARSDPVWSRSVRSSRKGWASFSSRRRLASRRARRSFNFSYRIAFSSSSNFTLKFKM